CNHECEPHPADRRRSPGGLRRLPAARTHGHEDAARHPAGRQCRQPAHPHHERPRRRTAHPRRDRYRARHHGRPARPGPDPDRHRHHHGGRRVRPGPRVSLLHPDHQRKSRERPGGCRDRRTRAGGTRRMTLPQTLLPVLAPLPVLIPLLTAAATLIVGRRPRFQRAVVMVALTAAVVVCAFMLYLADRDGTVAVQVGGWETPIGITIVVDRLSAAMMLVSKILRHDGAPY